MKYSKYNLLRKINNGFYIINLLSSEYLKLSEEEYKSIKENKKLSQDLIEKLMQKRFIVDKDFDEVQYLKDRYKKAQEEKDLLTVTIAPTLRCNFSCPYCYENKNGKIIDKEAQDKIISFIDKQLSQGYKKVDLIWFGGEPLMAYPIIKRMSKKIISLCEEKNVDYNAFMTTNGYLLNDDIINELENLKINQLYITLDGLAETHDKRRCLIDKTETFDKIVSNLCKLKNKKISTIIRMNIDRKNVDDIENLRKFVVNELELPMYLGLVRQYTDSCINENIYFNKEEYSKIQDSFFESQEKDGKMDYQMPRQLPLYCRACKVGTFVIDPDLNIFKCENDIGRIEKRISTIDNYPFLNEIQDSSNESYYKWNPFENDKCIQCEVLPICTGGCPYVGIKNDEPECEIYKYDINNVVKKYILQSENKK